MRRREEKEYSFFWHTKEFMSEHFLLRKKPSKAVWYMQESEELGLGYSRAQFALSIVELFTDH